MENLKQRWRFYLRDLLIALILFLAVSGFLLIRFKSSDVSVGAQMVRAMYEFSEFEDVEGQIKKLRPIVSDEVWKAITLNNDSRVISAYYKFQTKPSKVIIRRDEPGLMVFSLDTEYVLSDRLFVFEYHQEGHLVTEIREYELVGHSWGREGAIE